VFNLITLKVTEKTGNLVYARQVDSKEDLMIVSSRGKLIRIRIADVSEQSRNTQGVRVMNVENGEKVVAVENLPNDESSNPIPPPETAH
jgi:DNA gyrase subunit A